jgi:hypothetical protein
VFEGVLIEQFLDYCQCRSESGRHRPDTIAQPPSILERELGVGNAIKAVIIFAVKQIYWQETALWVWANQKTTAIFNFLEACHPAPTMAGGRFEHQLLGEIKVGRGDQYVDVVAREVRKVVAVPEHDPR